MTTLPISAELAREIAEGLIFDHARDIEYLTISERLTDHAEVHALDEADFEKVANHVADLIAKADVTVELTRPGSRIDTTPQAITSYLIAEGPVEDTDAYTLVADWDGFIYTDLSQALDSLALAKAIYPATRLYAITDVTP